MMDYGKILIQKPVGELLDKVRRFTWTVPEGYTCPSIERLYHPSVIRNTLETYSFLSPVEVESLLNVKGIPFTDVHSERVNLEDAFIGLTGKY